MDSGSSFYKNQAVGRIREVWANNLEEEMLLLSKLLDTHHHISFDTEFPGFLFPSPRDASEEQRFKALASNVNVLKLIQFGITLFDEQGNIGGCWQFNFCDFDINNDPYVPESISLLKKNGIDFEKNRNDGIDSENLAVFFHEIIATRPGLRWVTFHGVYDVAYLSKLLLRTNIPDSNYNELIKMMAYALGGEIYDVKLMAECCLGEVKGLGLEKLSRMLSVERVGEAHQAGSDSLLTAQLFLKLSQGAYRFIHKVFGGYLFGVGLRIDNKPWNQITVQLQQQRFMLQQHRYVPHGCYRFFDRQYRIILGQCRPFFVPIVCHVPMQRFRRVVCYKGWKPSNGCNLTVY